MKASSSLSIAAILCATVLPVASLRLDAQAQESLPANTDADHVLPEYEVTGTLPELVDTTTLRLPAKVLETPRSLSVLDANRLREQNFQNANDVLDWVPGLNANAGSYHFFARGFRMGPSDWKVDGFSGRVVGGSYSPNLFGYEQVVALKGPAGVLYGSASQPGGQISLVTKKPLLTPASSVSMRVRTFAGGGASPGNDLGAEVEVDSTGPVTRDGRVLYRFLGSVEQGFEQPSARDANQFYRLAFTYHPDEARRFSLTPSLEWSREDRGQRSTAISPSSSSTTSDGRTDYTLDDITPVDVNLNAGGRVDDNLTTTLDFDARLATDWSAAASLRYHERDYRNDAWTIQTDTLEQLAAADARSWVVSRRHTRAGNDYDNTSFDLNTTYNTRPLDGVTSRWQVGLNYNLNNTQAYTAQNGANQSPANIYTGDAAGPLVADASAVLPRGNLTRAAAWNAYLQNQTTIRDRFIVNLSGGFAGDSTRVTAPDGTSAGTTRRESGITPNAGLVYLPSPKTALYASYATSYSLPNTTYENAAGSVCAFDPTEGESWEIGGKAELWGDLLAASLTLFQTELNNILVQSDATDLNGNGNRYYRQVDGGRASRGIESECTMAITRHWTASFTYAWIDAHDRLHDGSKAGEASMTPEHAVSIFSRYTAQAGALAGWTFQGGLIAQSARWGGQSAVNATTNTDPLRLDAFYRLDFGVSKFWRGYNFALYFENIMDEEYLAGGSTGLNMQWANPRAVTFRVSRNW